MSGGRHVRQQPITSPVRQDDQGLLGARLGNALVGVLVGIALVVGGLVLLAWNEGRAVQTARSLAEAGGIR